MLGDGAAYESAAGRDKRLRARTAFVNLRTHLEAGATTMRDLGSHLDFLAWSPADPMVVPRVLRYGPPITAHRGHMHHFGGDVTDIDVAHERGALATTHALSREAIRRAVEAGTDGIEHLAFLTEDGRGEFDPELADLAVGHGVTFGSTLAVNNRYTQRAAAGELDPFDLGGQADRTAYYVHNAARLRERGARIVTASDAGWKHTHFSDLANELRLLTMAGYTPAETLHRATGLSADHLRLAAQIGYLAPGRHADLAVFDGDPTTDVSATARVRAVFREGEPVHARFA